jgi:hypothetical protein
MEHHPPGKLKFGFDLGQAFPALTSFLTTPDKLALGATCTLLRDILFSAHTWHTFAISDFDCPQWEPFLLWVKKYIDIIQPAHLAINLVEPTH